MTIALGILAHDGVVVAADRQVTIQNFWKGSQGKILGGAHVNSEGNDGACAITGAASRVGHLLVLGSQLGREFLDTQEISKREEMAPRFGEIVRRFSVEHVSPFPGLVEVDMIIGYQRRLTCGLWSTNLSTIEEHWDYAAVGIGAAHASTILRRTWKLGAFDVATAAVLAAFVAWSTKKNVDGCGELTDILCLRGNGFKAVPLNTVKTLEEIFTGYVEEHEPSLVRYLFASNPNHFDYGREFGHLRELFAHEIDVIRQALPLTPAEEERQIREGDLPIPPRSTRDPKLPPPSQE